MKSGIEETAKKNTSRKGVRRRKSRTRFKGVRQLEDGRYEVRARCTDPKTGKALDRKRQVPSDTPEAELLRIKAQLKRELLGQAPAKATPATLMDCALLWNEEGGAMGYSEAYLERRSQVLEKWLLPRLGDVRVHTLERRDLRQWLRDVSAVPKDNGEPHAEDTVKGWWRIVGTFVRWIVRQELFGLDHDPSAGIIFKLVVHRRLRRDVQRSRGPNSLTHVELRQLLEKARVIYPQHFALFAVGFFTGMRWSELSSLRWEDLDAQSGLIRIRRSQVRGRLRNRTKNGRPRTTAVDEWVVNVLLEYRQELIRRQAPGVESGLMFPSPKTGGYRARSSVTGPLTRLCEALGINKRLSSKAFRRTYVDLARTAQVDGLVGRAMVGHAAERLTAAYATVGPAERQNVAKEIGGLVRRSV